MAKVSPLKVRVFNACRLRFRYQYVDRIRSRLRIADTAGSLVHRVLCDIYSKVPRNERTRDRLLQIFDETWEALSPRYLRMEGVAELRVSSAKELEHFAEQHELRAEPLMVEPYFQVDLTPDVTLFGRVDRIDELSGGSLKIIDYKTGSAPEEIDPSQLHLYAIMIESELGRLVSEISFWFLGDGGVWTTDFTDDDREKTRADLFAAVEAMVTTRKFPPTIAPQCGHCPYLH
ncbi:MAG: PD-(D/E)XK nuclease family protein, partial [Chloroflexi bacterium]|nr:PD-(D/E)XK nuclease family protein [Chloroflexota bacterium]